MNSAPASHGGARGDGVGDGAYADQNLVAEFLRDGGDDGEGVGRGHGDLHGGDAALQQRSGGFDELVGRVGADDGDDTGIEKSLDDGGFGHGSACSLARWFLFMKRILHSTRLSLFSTGVLLWTCCIVAAAMGADSTPAAARQKLAALRSQADPHAVDIAWPYLNSTDPSVREAARLTVESQPFDSWKQRALDEKSAWGSIEALRALTEACPKAEAADVSAAHLPGDRVTPRR